MVSGFLQGMNYNNEYQASQVLPNTQCIAKGWNFLSIPSSFFFTRSFLGPFQFNSINYGLIICFMTFGSFFLSRLTSQLLGKLTTNWLGNVTLKLRAWVILIYFLPLSHVTRKPVFGVSDQVRLKPATQLQKLAVVLKFWIWQVDVLYYPGNENKDADQTVQMPGWSASLLFAYGINRFFTWHGAFYFCSILPLCVELWYSISGGNWPEFLLIIRYCKIKWTSSRENLSSGYVTR